MILVEIVAADGPVVQAFEVNSYWRLQPTTVGLQSMNKHHENHASLLSDVDGETKPIPAREKY